MKTSLRLSKRFQLQSRGMKRSAKGSADNKGRPDPSERQAKQNRVVEQTDTDVSHQKRVSVSESKNLEPTKLGLSFYDVPCATLARNLLGQCVVRSIRGQLLRGRIVETEAYIGPIDKAAHSYQGKQTPRNAAMFMRPGTSYVYNIYGMYCCMNISSQGDGAAVLIRALEPVEGHLLMREGRAGKSGPGKKPLKDKDLANGPSKLCQALHISKIDFDQTYLVESDSLWLERDEGVEDNVVVSCPRINIGYADDWVDKPLRFYILGNTSVSVKDKKAELLKKESSTETT